MNLLFTLYVNVQRLRNVIWDIWNLNINELLLLVRLGTISLSVWIITHHVGQIISEIYSISSSIFITFYFSFAQVLFLLFFIYSSTSIKRLFFARNTRGPMWSLKGRSLLIIPISVFIVPWLSADQDID